MMNSYYSRSRLKQLLTRALVVGVLAAIGSLSGLIPQFAKNSPTLTFSASVYAQSVGISDQEITNYAQAVLAMEPLRQAAYSEIKKIIGGSIPDIVCDRPRSLRTLPAEAQTIARNYCNQSAAIVANYFPRGRTARFNQITARMQTNQRLRRRIQNELVRLQR